MNTNAGCTNVCLAHLGCSAQIDHTRGQLRANGSRSRIHPMVYEYEYPRCDSFSGFDPQSIAEIHGNPARWQCGACTPAAPRGTEEKETIVGERAAVPLVALISWMLVLVLVGCCCCCYRWRAE